MIILKDTREKQGWTFQGEEVEQTALKTGDYSLKGFEDQICIERKKTVSELAQNVIQKRFRNEIKRMGEIPHSFLLLEFSRADVETYPFTSGLPLRVKKKIRIRGNYILKCLEGYLLDHNVQTIFCEDSLTAENFAFSIFYDFYSNL